MRFMIDNNLSEQLSNGMKAFGEDVIHLKEIFPAETADPTWLRHIGENQIFLVTRDEHIRWRPAEIQALKRHNVGAFFLGGKSRTRCDLIRQLVRNWPCIKESARRTRPPFAFRVRPEGMKIDRIALS